MQAPLIVLALQPGGRMSVKGAESLLRVCRSQRKLYEVVCCECTPPPPASAYADMSKRAYERAVFALNMPEYGKSVAAIGLHSYAITLRSGACVWMASLALIERDSPERPFLIEKYGNSSSTQVALVAEALRNWHLHKGAIARGPSVAAQVAMASLYTAAN